jgi:hypothetical protein
VLFDNDEAVLGASDPTQVSYKKYSDFFLFIPSFVFPSKECPGSFSLLRQVSLGVLSMDVWCNKTGDVQVARMELSSIDEIWSNQVRSFFSPL